MLESHEKQMITLDTAELIRASGETAELLRPSVAGAGGLSLTADGMSQDPETASEDGFVTLLVGASIYEMPVYLRT